MKNDKVNSILGDTLIKLGRIDYGKVFDILKHIVVLYGINKSVSLYKLQKQYKPKNVSSVEITPQLIKTSTKINKCKIATLKFKKEILKFIKVIFENFKEDDLINFYNNINGLTIRIKDYKFENFLLRESAIAKYLVRENSININELNIDLGIYHELFHMASTVLKNNNCYTGFYQILKDKKIYIGKGLNEGYTELLACRYFMQKEIVAYQYEVNIAEQLEKIIGIDKMQSLYLNANLYGLIQELKKYNTEEEIMKFLSDTDFLQTYASRKMTMSGKYLTIKSLRNINKFLIKTYIKKLVIDMQDRNLSADLAYVNLTNFTSDIISSIEFRNHEFNIMTPDEVEKYILECFNDIYFAYKTYEK